MTKNIFCRECGCEILSELDLGFEDLDVQQRTIFGIKDVVFKKVYICAACKDDMDRQWEEFKKTPEYQYECAFNRFCRQFDDDAYFREVTA